MAEKLSNTMSWQEITDHVAKKIKQDNPNFKKWMAEREILGYECDPFLWGRAYKIWKDLHKMEMDHVSVISGDEGGGKSWLGARLCAMVSPHTFRLRHICFKPEAVLENIKDCKPGDSIQLDEGALFLFSRDGMTSYNKIIVKLLTIVRAFGLHLCICVPNFFVMDTYVRDHRCKTLIQVTKRGKYVAFVGRGIKFISRKGRQNKQVMGHEVKPGLYWPGYWNKAFPEINDITEQTYKDHKLDNINSFIEDIEDIAKTDKQFISIPEAARMLGIGKETIRQALIKGQIEGRQIGRKWVINRSKLSLALGLKASEAN